MNDPTPELRVARAGFVALCVDLAPQRSKEARRTEAPREFDDLVSDTRCTHVDVRDRCLFIGTAPLIYRCGGAAYRVGDFAIRINTSTKEITCLGSVLRKSQYGNHGWHPHVLQTGQPCFGQGSVQRLTNWFGDGRLAHIGFFMIEYLCLARGTSEYVPSNLWPRLNDKEIDAWNMQHPEASSSFQRQSSTRPLSSSPDSEPVAPRRRWFSRS